MPESGAGLHPQDQLEFLIQDFRTSTEPPMPVFVVHAQESADDDAVTGLVRQLYAGQGVHGTRCAVAQDAYEGPTEVRRAAAMVRALSDPKKWGDPKALYRRYAFPRLRLVHAIDDAVAAFGDALLGARPGQPRGRSGPAAAAAEPAGPAALAAEEHRALALGPAAVRHGAHPPGEPRAVLAALLARSDWHMALAAGLSAATGLSPRRSSAAARCC